MDRVAALRRDLAHGDRREIGKASKVARDVLDDAGLLLPVITLLRDPDPAVTAHAAHALMQVAEERPGFFRPHTGALLDALETSDRWELGEQIPKILAGHDLSGDEAARLARILLRLLEGRSAIAAASALTALVNLAERGQIPAQTTERALAFALSSPSKALAARARRHQAGWAKN